MALNVYTRAAERNGLAGVPWVIGPTEEARRHQYKSRPFASNQSIAAAVLAFVLILWSNLDAQSSAKATPEVRLAISLHAKTGAPAQFTGTRLKP
eukprot:8492711-Pyramimonas_sp.AAC.1